MILHADQPVEILDALDLARELKLKAVISGGSEAWKVADAIKKADVPVLIAGTLNLPRHPLRPLRLRLHQPGQAACRRRHDRDPLPVRRLRRRRTAARNLPYEAATAVAFGLPEDVALKAVTHRAGADSGRRRPGWVAGNRQTRQHRRDRGSPARAHDTRARPLHRRRAGPAGKPSHPALREISPPARRSSGRPRRLGIDEAPTKLSGAAAPLPAKTQAERQ